MADTDLSDLVTYWEEKVLLPFTAETMARKLINRNPDVDGPGIHKVKVSTMTGMQEATIAYRPQRGEAKRESIKLTSAELQIPYVEQEYYVERMNYDAWLANRNIDLNSLTINEAGRTVAEKEDQMLLLGWDQNGDGTYDVQGAYTAAGSAVSTSYDFATNGNAYDAVCDVLALIDGSHAKSYNGYNLVLPLTQYYQLLKSKDSNQNYEIPDVLRLLNERSNAGAGQVLSYHRIPTDHGLLLPIDPERRFVEFYNPSDLVTEAWTDPTQPNRSDIYGRTYVHTVPHILKAEGIGRLDTI